MRRKIYEGATPPPLWLEYSDCLSEVFTWCFTIGIVNEEKKIELNHLSDPLFRCDDLAGCSKYVFFSTRVNLRLNQGCHTKINKVEWNSEGKLPSECCDSFMKATVNQYFLELKSIGLCDTFSLSFLKSFTFIWNFCNFVRNLIRSTLSCGTFPKNVYKFEVKVPPISIL